MIAELCALGALARFRRRARGAALLGALTIVCGVGLMATAGYLIARAAQQPAILSLTVAIVGVRFFGLTRPLARYAERLATHDVALRVLARVRVAVYARIAPLAPAQLEGYRRGDLLARVVADVDALQDLHGRAVGPALAGALAAALASAPPPRSSRAPGSSSPRGWPPRASAYPCWPARSTARPGVARPERAAS